MSHRFAIVTSIEPPTGQRAEMEGRGAVLITVRPGGELHRWLTEGRANAALVRPDGTVLDAGLRVSMLCTHLPVATRMS